MEDSALTLKKKIDNGTKINKEEAIKMLVQSKLIDKLLVDPNRAPNTFVGLRAYEWRLLQLSEIPFCENLGKVQNWLSLLVEKTYIPEGFSLTRKKDGLLACHNAMITSILIRMNYNDKDKIDRGIKWILDYQSAERGIDCKWQGKDLFTRFGGCMKKTPCFHGVVKSMVTLTEYKKKYGGYKELDNKLDRGLEYIFQHRLFKKLSSDQPIEPSIILNFYPYPYRTNIIEILSLLKSNHLLEDERCNEARSIVKNKQRKDGFWQVDKSFMKSAWVDFDIPKKPGLWISYIISKII